MKTYVQVGKMLLGILVLTLMGSGAKAQPFLTNGLVAYYPFNGNAHDSSSNGNNGTLLGSAAFGTDRFGNPNSCLALPGTSGTGSGVDVPSLANLSYSPVTYSAWFLLANYPPAQSYSVMPLLGRAQCGDQVGGTVCLYTQVPFLTNQLIYYTGATGFSTAITPPTNKWFQIVVTIDQANNPTMYINGVSSPGTGSAPPGQPLDFRIGNATPGGCSTGNYFAWNGLLDDIRIYRTNFSAAQVQQLYQLESPPCSGGVAAATAIITNGFVVGANVTDGGCGYTNVPPVLIQGGGGSGATAVAVVSNQFVVGITITDAGSNYLSPPTIYIGEVPVITSQPQSVTVNDGDPATFQVVSSGSLQTYQWSVNGANIPGATTSILTFTNVDPTNLGTYVVTVSNAFGPTNSSPAVLAMYPLLTMPFGGLETLWGYTNTLSVMAVGSGPLDFQWYDDGVAINGATNDTLTFTGIQPTNSGLYTVVVSNPYGSVTNTPEQVVVEPAGISLGLSPAITITGVVGNVYTIQRNPDLSNTNSWTTLTNLTLTDPVQIWVDTNLDASLPSHPEQFYRVLPGQ